MVHWDHELNKKILLSILIKNNYLLKSRDKIHLSLKLGFASGVQTSLTCRATVELISVNCWLFYSKQIIY